MSMQRRKLPVHDPKHMEADQFLTHDMQPVLGILSSAMLHDNAVDSPLCICMAVATAAVSNRRKLQHLKLC
jgi:hypothetical protein